MSNIFFVSLGCDKNLADTEMMLHLLTKEGHTITDNEAEAEIIIINSCCFIGDAKEESINTIIEMGEYKESGKCRGIILTGCLAQRYPEDIRKDLPEVDVLVGTLAIDKICLAVNDALKGIRSNYFEDINRAPFVCSQVITTGGHYGFLKIAEGCNKRCSYCIIPSVRGNYRSVPMERILENAKEMVKSGVKELILVAQETTLYGTDIYGKKKLPELLTKLCEIDGVVWIRILYCYPEEITDELIAVMKKEPKICHYIDMPIQHASDDVLRRMGRRTTRAEITERIREIRKEIPDICLRTTFITGFPGETEEDHRILLDFVSEIRFDRVGVFTYSPEENTRACSMPGKVPERLKKKRQLEIIKIQQNIAFEKAKALRRTNLLAMIEGEIVSEEDRRCYVARTYMDSPSVDGYLFINTDGDYMSGDFVNVTVTGSHEYDLIGEISEVQKS